MWQTPLHRVCLNARASDENAAEVEDLILWLVSYLRPHDEAFWADFGPPSNVQTLPTTACHGAPIPGEEVASNRTGTVWDLLIGVLDFDVGIPPARICCEFIACGKRRLREAFWVLI